MGLFDWLFGKKKEPIAVPSYPPSSWKGGERVLAKWVDSLFYPGRVQAVAGDSCQIAFDDGDTAWVHQANVRRPEITHGGRIHCRLGGGPQYLPGTALQQKGEKIHVRFDNGQDEWTTLSMVRVQLPVAPVQEPFLPGPKPMSLAGGFGVYPALAAGPAGPGQVAPGPAAPLDLGEPLTAQGNWALGDRVLARWFDFYWYPGTILALGTKGFHILYDDGDQRVILENQLMPLAVEEGEAIFIRPKKEVQRIYHPATVVHADGEMIDVEFEDGTRENNLKVSRARFWRCPVGYRSFAFEEGDRVLAWDLDGYIYPAEIVSIHEDRVTVQFLDGLERMLTPELIQRFQLRVGQKIECRWKGGQVFFPGVLKQIDNERLFIHYDDGDQEWTSVRLVRLPPGERGASAP